MGVTKKQIEEFCKAADVEFYQWGCPEDWTRRDVFRVATHDYPQRGITVTVKRVLEWAHVDMFAGANI